MNIITFPSPFHTLSRSLFKRFPLSRDVLATSNWWVAAAETTPARPPAQKVKDFKTFKWHDFRKFKSLEVREFTPAYECKRGHEKLFRLYIPAKIFISYDISIPEPEAINLFMSYACQGPINSHLPTSLRSTPSSHFNDGFFLLMGSVKKTYETGWMS